MFNRGCCIQSKKYKSVPDSCRDNKSIIVAMLLAHKTLICFYSGLVSSMEKAFTPKTYKSLVFINGYKSSVFLFLF